MSRTRTRSDTPTPSTLTKRELDDYFASEYEMDRDSFPDMWRTFEKRGVQQQLEAYNNAIAAWVPARESKEARQEVADAVLAILTTLYRGQKLGNRGKTRTLLSEIHSHAEYFIGEAEVQKLDERARKAVAQEADANKESGRKPTRGGDDNRESARGQKRRRSDAGQALRRSGRRRTLTQFYVPGTVEGSAESRKVCTTPLVRKSNPLSDGFVLGLYFHTHSKYVATDDSLTELLKTGSAAKCTSILFLEFDAQGKFVQSTEDTTTLECVVHLIKRASERLALNSTNDEFALSKTQLDNVALFVPRQEGDCLDEYARTPVEETRQYTRTQKFKAALKTGVAGLAATAAGAGAAALAAPLGVVAAPVLAAKLRWDADDQGRPLTGLERGVRNVRAARAAVGGLLAAPLVGAAASGFAGYTTGKQVLQVILGDEYLRLKDIAFFTKDSRKAASVRAAKHGNVDIPFAMVITDLYFEGLWPQSHTLKIQGTFVQGKVYREKQPTEIRHVRITDAVFEMDDEKGDRRKAHERFCRNNNSCFLFSPEV